MSEEGKFSQQAIAWWPFLKVLVSSVNVAAKDRDRIRLDQIFVEAVNSLDMRVEKNELKRSGIITRADLLNDFHILIAFYKRRVADITAKKAKLKNPRGQGGKSLSAGTLKQYRYSVSSWPKDREKLKSEIKLLHRKIKSMGPSTVMRKFRNDLTLTVYQGGKMPAGYVGGDREKVNVIVKEAEEVVQDHKERHSIDVGTFTFWKKEPLSGELPMTSAFDVWLRMKDLAKADQESAWIIGLNIQGIEIYCDCVSVGGINHANIDSKLVFKRLVSVGASKFIFVHNHPSGDPTPSREDIEVTNRLREIGETVGIPLLQSVIIGDYTYDIV